MADGTKNSNKAHKAPKEPRRAPLDAAKKEEMLAILIRNKLAFETVVDMLSPEHLRRGSEGLALVWTTVREFHKKFDALPARSALVADLHEAVAANPDLLGSEELEELDKFVEYTFDDKEHGEGITDPKSTHCKIAVATCKQLLEEYTALALRSRLLKNDTLPTNIPTVLAEHQAELDALESLTEIEIDKPFPAGWDKRKNTKLFTTGCEVLDDFMGGGWRGGEVILFMGPYGSCKTSLVCHAVSQLIREAADLYADGKSQHDDDGNPMVPMAVLVFTESDKAEYRNRLLSNLARVKWTRLAQMDSLKSLDDSSQPATGVGTKYEKWEFRKEIKQGHTFESEQQRVKNAVKLCNKHLLLLDCTDSEDNPHQIGRGGIPEIANVVRAAFRKRSDCYPFVFWVDHISALADRVAQGDPSADDKLHLILKRMLLQAGDKLAKPWKAPVGLMHQLSGQANKKRSPAAKMHHTDAAGSTSIGEYAVFCIEAGPVDEAQMCVWQCTKHRREPPTSHKIVKIEGRFNRIVDSSATHTADFTRGGIFSKAELTAKEQYAKANKSLQSGDTLENF